MEKRGDLRDRRNIGDPDPDVHQRLDVSGSQLIFSHRHRILDPGIRLRTARIVWNEAVLGDPQSVEKLYALPGRILRIVDQIHL